MSSSLCQGTRATTVTRSTSGCDGIRLMSWKARSAPNFSAEAFAVSACAVHTAFSSKFGNACSAGTWALAPQPLPPGVTVAPTIPTLTLSATILFPLCVRRLSTHWERSIALQCRKSARCCLINGLMPHRASRGGACADNGLRGHRFRPSGLGQQEGCRVATAFELDTRPVHERRKSTRCLGHRTYSTTVAVY